MISVFCVCVKPAYTLDDVVMLYDNVKQHLKLDFEFICLTDTEMSHKDIQFIDVSSYDLDTWWNKVLVFSEDISKDINLYFDLDVKINQDITPLLDQIDGINITVVDTPWKDKQYFAQKYKGLRAYKIGDALFHYGNTSVMGWRGHRQQLVDLLLNDVFHHTSKNYGDDTFINRNSLVRYFDFDIQRYYNGMPPCAISI